MESRNIYWFILLVTLVSCQPPLCDQTEECSRCSGPPIIVSDTIDILCDGNRGCNCADAVSAPSVVCSGNDGCREAGTISASTTDIICSGDESCELAEIIIANHSVFCLGFESCREAETPIRALYEQIRCDGALGCFQADRIQAQSRMYQCSTTNNNNSLSIVFTKNKNNF